MNRLRIVAAVLATPTGVRVRLRSGASRRGERTTIGPADAGFASRVSRTGVRGRLGAVVAEAALRAAALGSPDGTVFLVVAMERGSERDDRAYWRTVTAHGDALASPAGFTATLPSAIAGEIAAAHRLTGPCLVFSGDVADALSMSADIAASPSAGVRHVLLVAIRGDDDAEVRARAILIRAERAGASDAG